MARHVQKEYFITKASPSWKIFLILIILYCEQPG